MPGVRSQGEVDYYTLRSGIFTRIIRCLCDTPESNLHTTHMCVHNSRVYVLFCWMMISFECLLRAPQAETVEPMRVISTNVRNTRNTLRDAECWHPSTWLMMRWSSLFVVHTLPSYTYRHLTWGKHVESNRPTSSPLSSSPWSLPLPPTATATELKVNGVVVVVAASSLARLSIMLLQPNNVWTQFFIAVVLAQRANNPDRANNHLTFSTAHKAHTSRI